MRRRFSVRIDCIIRRRQDNGISDNDKRWRGLAVIVGSVIHVQHCVRLENLVDRCAALGHLVVRNRNERSVLVHYDGYSVQSQSAEV